MENGNTTIPIKGQVLKTYIKGINPGFWDATPPPPPPGLVIGFGLGLGNRSYDTFPETCIELIEVTSVSIGAEHWVSWPSVGV